jgi:hypothetical protein
VHAFLLGGKDCHSPDLIPFLCAKVVVEQGPRALQQDAGLIEAVGGGVPVICVCDGHGSVAMLQMDQGKTPREVQNLYDNT